MESIEDISKIILCEKSDILIMGYAKAVKKIVSIGGTELFGVSKLSMVGVEIVMLLNGFNHIAFALHLQHFLGENYMSVMNCHIEMA